MRIDELMWIIDILIGLALPVFIPLFSSCMHTVEKPSANNMHELIEEKRSAFMQEFPTAFIGNAIWGMTYQINTSSGANQFWIPLYAIIALFSCIPLLLSSTDINPVKYNCIVAFCCIVLVLVALLRIFAT